MKLSHQKLKMMYLAKILMEQTDEEHTITVPEMIDELSNSRSGKIIEYSARKSLIPFHQTFNSSK